jgi:hypothetical protein
VVLNFLSKFGCFLLPVLYSFYGKRKKFSGDEICFRKKRKLVSNKGFLAPRAIDQIARPNILTSLQNLQSFAVPDQPKARSAVIGLQ